MDKVINSSDYFGLRKVDQNNIKGKDVVGLPPRKDYGNEGQSRS